MTAKRWVLVDIAYFVTRKHGTCYHVRAIADYCRYVATGDTLDEAVERVKRKITQSYKDAGVSVPDFDYHNHGKGSELMIGNYHFGKIPLPR